MLTTKNFAKFTFTLFLLLLCLPLTRQGMFVDGIWYAAIAKNMAIGLGNIWDPALSKTWFLHFREHPPLNMAMLSVFFRLFGDAFWVERLYSFTIVVLQLIITYKLWLQQNPSTLKSRSFESTRANFTRLVFLWLIIPVNIGMYKDNLLEAGLTLFTTLACLRLIKPFQSYQAFVVNALLSGLFMVLGFMCNGPTALFPLAIPLLYHFFFNKPELWPKAVHQSIILSFVTGFCFFLFFLVFPKALANIKGYFDIQLMAAITGQRDLSFVGWKHFYIFYIYLKDYFWLGLVALIVMMIDARIRNQSFRAYALLYAKNPWFRFYVALSLCASLPVGISHRQMFHYISASAPLILLAFMHLIKPAFDNITIHLDTTVSLKKHKQIGSIFTVCCLVSIGIVSLKTGGYNKNQRLIEDVQKVAKFIGINSTVEGSPEILSYFDVPVNFARYSMISFVSPDTIFEEPAKYYISYPHEKIPTNYEVIEMGLSYFKLAEVNKG